MFKKYIPPSPPLVFFLVIYALNVSPEETVAVSPDGSHFVPSLLHFATTRLGSPPRAFLCSAPVMKVFFWVLLSWVVQFTRSKLPVRGPVSESFLVFPCYFLSIRTPFSSFLWESSRQQSSSSSLGTPPLSPSHFQCLLSLRLFRRLSKVGTLPTIRGLIQARCVVFD